MTAILNHPNSRPMTPRPNAPKNKNLPLGIIKTLPNPTPPSPTPQQLAIAYNNMRLLSRDHQRHLEGFIRDVMEGKSVTRAHSASLGQISRAFRFTQAKAVYRQRRGGQYSEYTGPHGCYGDFNYNHPFWMRMFSNTQELLDAVDAWNLRYKADKKANKQADTTPPTAISATAASLEPAPAPTQLYSHTPALSDKMIGLALKKLQAQITELQGRLAAVENRAEQTQAPATCTTGELTGELNQEEAPKYTIAEILGRYNINMTAGERSAVGIRVAQLYRDKYNQAPPENCRASVYELKDTDLVLLAVLKIYGPKRMAG